MNKQELATIIAREHGTSVAEAERIIDTAVGVIANTLVAGDSVNLGRDFGSLVIRETAARKVKSIKTGEMIDVPAGKKVAFAPSSKLKEKVNA